MPTENSSQAVVSTKAASLRLLEPWDSVLHSNVARQTRRQREEERDKDGTSRPGNLPAKKKKLYSSV